jgi:hypothetical protein
VTLTLTPAKPIEEIYSVDPSQWAVMESILEYVEKILTRDFQNNQSVVIETRKAIQYFLDKRAEFLGYGSTRICFADDSGRVIKIPFRRSGYTASSREVTTYENFHKDPDAGWTPVAECFFTELEGIQIWLLSMERVQTFSRRGKVLPDWVDTVDCGQVGYNSNGELVAYDL